MGKRGYRSFQHVVENLAKHFAYSAENCPQHPGYKFNYFDSFQELDNYFKREFGENWREQEWAKFWLRDHNAFETREHDRALINERGVRYRSQNPDSIRNRRNREGPKQLRYRVAPSALASFIVDLQSRGVTSLREVAASIYSEYGIKLSHETIRRIKKKYNL